MAKRQGRRAPQGQDNEGGDSEDYVADGGADEPKKGNSDGGDSDSATGDSDDTGNRNKTDGSVEYYGPIYPEYSDDE